MQTSMDLLSLTSTERSLLDLPDELLLQVDPVVLLGSDNR